MRSQAEVAFARAQKEKAKEGGIFSFLRGKKSKPDKKGILLLIHITYLSRLMFQV